MIFSAADLGWTIKGPYSAGILNLMVCSTLTFLPTNLPPSPTNLLFASTQHPLKTRLATVWHMIPALCNSIEIIWDKIYHLPISAQTMGPFSFADLGAWLSGEEIGRRRQNWHDLGWHPPKLSSFDHPLTKPLLLHHHHFCHQMGSWGWAPPNCLSQP